MFEYKAGYSPRASLGAFGLQMRAKRIWSVVEGNVKIKQKVRDHTPTEKLMDALINILAGGHGLVEINTRVRSDRLLQEAFGRERCAEQSTVSDTMNACDEENVAQMRQALQEILRRHGHAYKHSYKKKYQVLDVDITGLPGGRKGEGVTKGYFSGRRGRRGRQVGRVTATLYDEIVVDRLYTGKVQLERSLQELVEAAEGVLGLTEERRTRTIVRVDGGGGRDADIDWLLERGYSVIAKVKNWQRSVKLAGSVKTWYADPKVEGRELGWVEEQHSYARPTRQLVMRKPKRDGSWHYTALVLNLGDAALARLAREPVSTEPTDDQVLLIAMHAYDLRGGGIETSNRNSKQGLGLNKRNKRLFAAQEMLVLLAALAYNLLTWLGDILEESDQAMRGYGKLRIVRDVFHIPGKAIRSLRGRLKGFSLDEQHWLAPHFHAALSPLLRSDHLSLNLGKI